MTMHFLNDVDDVESTGKSYTIIAILKSLRMCKLMHTIPGLRLDIKFTRLDFVTAR